MIKVFVLNFSKCSGLSVRSAFWMGEKILVGTNAGEVFEVIATEKDKPKTIVQVGIKISVRECLSSMPLNHYRFRLCFPMLGSC